MTQNISSHIIEQIEAYLSDGLSPDERLAFESHVGACQTCAAALADAREADANLRHLFSDARPAAGFEDHIVRNLRLARAPRLRIFHPMVLRTAAGIAAAVVLAGAGVVVSHAIDDGTSPMLFADSLNYGAQETFGLRDEAQAMQQNPSGGWELRGAGRVNYQHGDGDGDGVLTKAMNERHSLTHREDADLSERLSRNDRSTNLTLGADQKSKEALDRYPGDSAPALNARISGADAFHPTEQLGVGMKIDKSDRGVIEHDMKQAAVSAALSPVSAGNPNSSAKGAKSDVFAFYQKSGWQEAPPKPAPEANDPAAGELGRKIIRNGTMEFEVSSFDDALTRITKLVTEQGGFIGTTDSDKLANGKVKGIVTVRVPPQHLDTLVLTLHGIGDLKSQKITAEDVTRHYTDLQSQLRAAQAMYDRLIDIIKTGKGQIKDLVEAEKQLGVWEVKSEQLKGEQHYLENLVSLSTLTISLYEKDIKTPAVANETEQVQMSLETEKVDEAYNKAIEAIKAAKGRIAQSELKQYDAGQLGATISAAIPPDGAEQVIARLRQLDGRIAHFSRDRQQTTQSGEAAPAGVVHVQRQDLVLSMQIYNLANVAPRRTTAVQLAATDVEHAYQQVIDQVRSAGGRIVSSSLAKPDASSQAADLEFQAPADKSDTLLSTIRGYGDVMRQETTENPDTANVTEAKRGVHLRIVSLSAVPPRETETVTLAAANVPQAFNDIVAAVKAADGRVLQSDLRSQNAQDVTGTIAFEVSRAASPAINVAIDKTAEVLTRAVNRSADTQNTVDTKLRLTLVLSSSERLPPRQTTTVREEVSDVERAVDDLVNAATSAGGRRIGGGAMNQDRAGHVTAQVVVDVPLARAGAIVDSLERVGYRRSKQVAYDNAVTDGPLARARIDATFSNSGASLGGEESTWDAIRHGLGTSGRGLRLSLQYLIVGLCFVAPWVFLVWILWRVIRRPRSRQPIPTT